MSRENRGIYKITESGLLESKNSKELDSSYLTDKYPILKEKYSKHSNANTKIYKTIDITAEESISNATKKSKPVLRQILWITYLKCLHILLNNLLLIF